MKNSVFAFPIFLLILSMSILAQKPSPTPDDDVVKISTTLIQIDVTVTDTSGKIVSDLKPDDFEIYENGKKQDMTNFLFVTSPQQTYAPKIAKVSKKAKPEDKLEIPIPTVELKPHEVKRTLALIVDDLGLSFQSMVGVRAALRNFVENQMQPNDLVAIIVVGNGAGSLQQFTSDKKMLLSAVDKMKWNPQGRAGITTFTPISDNVATTTDSTETTDEAADLASAQQQMYGANYLSDILSVGTLGAINYAAKGMTGLPGKKSVMLFSDGFPVCNQDKTTGEVDIDRCKRMEDALRLLTDVCNRASVSIYTFNAVGLANTMPDAGDAMSGMGGSDIAKSSVDRAQQISDNQQGLGSLADATGGIAFANRNDLSDGIVTALADQSGYYLLGYQPDSAAFDSKTLKYNKLQVKVKRPGLVVRYRQGFLGVTDVAPIKTSNNPTDQTVAALMSPFSANQIGLRLNTLFGNNAKGAILNSYLHIDAKDLTFVDQPDGTKKVSFEVLASSFGENGATIDQIGRSYRLTFNEDTWKQVVAEGFVYNFDFPVKQSGALQMRVAVRDIVSAKVGSTNQFVEIPDLKKGRLALSGIVLDSLSDNKAEDISIHATSNDITIGSGDPMTDTTMRRFQSGVTLQYVLEIYNAKTDPAQKPNLQTQIRVFKDGVMLFKPVWTPFNFGDQADASHIKFGGKLKLGSELAPGDYILQILVKDTLAKVKNNLAVETVQFEILKK